MSLHPDYREDLAVDHCGEDYARLLDRLRALDLSYCEQPSDRERAAHRSANDPAERAA